MMYTVAPSVLCGGYISYPKFPQWLGTNQVQRKSQRNLRELRLMCGHTLYIEKKAIQTEAVPLIFDIIVKHLQT